MEQSTISSCSSLLRLPPELRSAIYDEIVQHYDLVIIDHITKFSQRVVAHPLTQTCRQIRHELGSSFDADSRLKHAPEVQLNIKNFQCVNVAVTLNRLPAPALGNDRQYILHVHIDDGIPQPTYWVYMLSSTYLIHGKEVDIFRHVEIILNHDAFDTARH